MKINRNLFDSYNNYRLFDGKYYEEKYFNSIYSKCPECEEYHLTDGMTDVGGRHDYKWICQDCLDSYYSFCEKCDSYHNNDNMIKCDWCSQWVCENCFRSDGHGTTICDSCYEDNCYPCNDCGCFTHSDNICYSESEDEYYCEDCIQDHTGVINEYNYKPDPIFYGEGLCFFGVELEVDKGYNCNDTAEEIINNNEEIYCKYDGSLNDGFEIVSHPCTLDYHLNNLQWQDIITTCINNDFKSHDAETCGLHVHISRDAFGNNFAEQEMNAAKLLYIFEKFWSEIKTFSRRTDKQIDEWGKKLWINRKS